MALDPYTPIPEDLTLALAGSRFEEATECIEKMFAANGIKTVEDLDNSPRRLTCSFCGVNTGPLVIHIRDWLESYEEAKEMGVAEAALLSLQEIASGDEEE